MPPRPTDSDRGVLDDGTEFDLCVVGLRVGGGLMSGSGREMGKDRGAGRRRFIRREWVVVVVVVGVWLRPCIQS